MIYFKSIYLYTKASIFFIFFSPIMILYTIFFPSQLYKFARFISKGIFMSFNIKIKIIGEFPVDGPYILMHNHTSFLDLFLLPTIIKGKYTGIIAKKNFSIPLIGSILKQLHAIPINRSNIKSAKESIAIAEQFLQKGFHIAIFPEGTRTINGKLNPFKKGGFHMAINTNTKIIPIIVQGLYNIKPKTRWTIQPGTVNIIINDPIETTNKNIDTLLSEVESIYLDYDLA